MEGLHIESDGTVEGTHVYLDGAEVRDVTAVTWNFSPKLRKTVVTLEISNVSMSTVTHPTEEQRREIAETMLRAAHATPTFS